MNDPQLAITKINELLSDSRNVDPSSRPGYYAAVMNLIRELGEHIADKDDDIPERSYLKEKIVTLKWHTGAMFGFDIDNGLSSERHNTSALGVIQILQRTIKDEA